MPLYFGGNRPGGRIYRVVSDDGLRRIQVDGRRSVYIYTCTYGIYKRRLWGFIRVFPGSPIDPVITKKIKQRGKRVSNSHPTSDLIGAAEYRGTHEDDVFARLFDLACEEHFVQDRIHLV
jgi:hypothetical protein